ncbi:hypothetical protein [Mycobacterium riyadhense]|uniref:hypothetical protein n=2 Tax=Mycobacterium riyadhense TaxID=486698 RepID=UPI001EF9EEFB|nr:hypothetical protein [Mycobacterium riyadhense]
MNGTRYGDRRVTVGEDVSRATVMGPAGLPLRGCSDALQRWGYGRRRHVRSIGAAAIDVRPRRVRCGGCETTDVLLPAALQPRRADVTEVIGAAVAAVGAVATVSPKLRELSGSIALLSWGERSCRPEYVVRIIGRVG